MTAEYTLWNKNLSCLLTGPNSTNGAITPAFIEKASEIFVFKKLYATGFIRGVIILLALIAFQDHKPLLFSNTNTGK